MTADLSKHHGPLTDLFAAPAAQLLGGPVRFWHDQLFCKPARHGGVVAWHQDYSYWTRTTPLAHLTCWVGLDDATRENGCVHYVPGSHLWPDLPATGLTGEMGAIESVLTEEQKQQFRPVPAAPPSSTSSATASRPTPTNRSSKACPSSRRAQRLKGASFRSSTTRR